MAVHEFTDPREIAKLEVPTAGYRTGACSPMKRSWPDHRAPGHGRHHPGLQRGENRDRGRGQSRG